MAQLTPASEDTRIYELSVLYPYPFSQKEEQELFKTIEEQLSEAGAKVIFKDVWGRRGLAYRIGGFHEGNYAIYYVDMDPSKLKEIDTQFKIVKGILRHLIVKPPKHYQIMSFAERYEQWQKEEVTREERVEQEKEDKKLKQVVDKAKRQVKKVEKKEAPEAKASGAEIGQQLEKLISDDSMDL